MPQQPGTVNAAFAIRIDTKRRYDAMCEEYGYPKGTTTSNILEYFMSLTETERHAIAFGRTTVEKRRERFRNEVMLALEEIERRRSDPPASQQAKTKRHGSSD